MATKKLLRGRVAKGGATGGHEGDVDGRLQRVRDVAIQLLDNPFRLFGAAHPDEYLAGTWWHEKETLDKLPGSSPRRSLESSPGSPGHRPRRPSSELHH